MYLAVILYCAIPTDATSCEVMIRKNHMHETEILCEEEIKIVAKGLLETGHYVKAKCFERSGKEFYGEDEEKDDDLMT